MSAYSSNPAPESPGRCAALPRQLVLERVLPTQSQRNRLARSDAQYASAGITDYYFSDGLRESAPQQIFERLRWGGQFVFISTRQREAQALLDQYRQRTEYHVPGSLEAVSAPRRGLRFGPWRRRYFYFVARKVLLVPEDQPNDRHSYDVRLVPWRDDPGRGDVEQGYVVLKRVPTQAAAVRRLALRFPEVQPQVIEQGARKLVEKVYPLFLTREAAFLKILARQLPEEHRHAVPHALDLLTDERGLVQELRVNWLRLGGEPISQLDFARQAAQLLHVLHDNVHVVHLDLRLDNIVVTDRGVGFVDFGSAVRVGENLDQNVMLRTLFGEMLSASQISRDLRRLVRSGKVTSNLFRNCYRQIDRAVDLFYLVLQMNRPHANPDLKGLITFDPESDEAQRLARLTRAILQPLDPARPTVTTAAEFYEDLMRL